MATIKIAIVGIGNCVSSLLQGIEYYKDKNPAEAIGLMHWEIGGYKPFDIEMVAAFDVDQRKVGKDIHEAIFERPNCTKVFCEHLPKAGVKVRMGKILDGFSEHMKNYDDDCTFILSDEPEPSKEDIVRILNETGTEVLVNYLPVGSEEATRFYAQCALDAGVAFINNIPVFIASDPEWAKKFEARVKLERTYQLNTGGNTDFLNMLNRSRLASKKESKTEAVQAVAKDRLDKRDIHIGPSDWVPWQDDNKVCFIRMEGKLFGDVPMNLELRLSVEDSPNSAGVAIDSIRCCKLALERGIGGVLDAPSSYLCKHPPRQFPDDLAFRMTNEFIDGQASKKKKAAIMDIPPVEKPPRPKPTVVSGS